MFWCACICWFVCMYVCYRFFSKTTGPNCMKFSGMICHHPRTNRLDFGSSQVKGQGQGHEGLKNYWTKLHENFRDDLSSSKDQSNRFWEWSGQRSRSQKGQQLIFVITHSFCPIHMKPTPKCSIFNSLSSDRSKFKVTKRSKTYFGHSTLSFRPIHMKPKPKGSLFNSLSSDRSR